MFFLCLLLSLWPIVSFAKTQAMVSCRKTSRPIICMKELAKNNNIPAQYNLALMYANAQGIQKNDKKACYWFRKSAKQGYAKAQLSLAVYYYKGLGGLKKDYNKTIYWLKQSASQGYAPAKTLLKLTLSQR